MKTQVRDWVVGIDIGGTSIVTGIVPRAGGPPRGLRSAPTLPARGVEAVIADIVRLVDEALAEAGLGFDDVAGVGVGCPGPVDRRAGIVSDSPNLGWRDVPLRSLLEARFSRPVTLENDANCAIWGEWWQGAGQGSRSVFGVVIGTGVGGGWISNGELVHGASDVAGEIGHTTVVLDGRRCACGNRGCVEAYAGGPSIAARAREALASGASSILVERVAGDLDRLDAATIFAAAADDDPLAKEVVRETARILGATAANLVNLVNPDVIVFMGGVSGAGELLFAPLRAEVDARAFRAAASVCRIVPGTLGGSAGVVGAAGRFLHAEAHSRVGA
ncbi:MAG: ROK family protein [Longimicrobiales bacterium]|nr:ROK family protein [Longimicrobiales bacterium]